ncbi:hypothetical protein H5410_016942 [Solanum commersonii]|uniref:Uncharacterized protein n=1 Tax=Solanum commersonii TaxID=4109 RepID=A0A9J5ZXP8_SOLCO|nr:hypothetical protein H5410_016942 [Solanum commersonii]
MGELLTLMNAKGWTTLVLQGNRRRKMARKDTREFYINVVGSVSSISSSVGGVSFTLTAEVWKKYWVYLTWDALEISRRFANDPTLENYTRVDKGAMLPLHKLLFDVVHKIILPRKQKRMEANYLDLTLMELLISQVHINLPKLILSHINRICVDNSTEHGLGYGFWLGDIFEYFQVPIEEWKEQTIKGVLGVVDHAAILTTSRGANAPMQRIESLVSHSATIDQLHIDYGLKHARLAEENSRLKEELAQTLAALNTERSSNSDCLKHLYEILTKGSPSLSSALPPSV